jgi:hypothetical protein
MRLFLSKLRLPHESIINPLAKRLRMRQDALSARRPIGQTGCAFFATAKNEIDWIRQLSPFGRFSAANDSLI